MTDWPTCEHCGVGIKATGFDYCLAHLKQADLDVFLDRLKPGADLDARGATISQDLLTQFTMAVRGDFGVLNLAKAEFESAVRFGPLFAHRIILDRARFARHADIEVWAAAWVTCGGTRFEDGVTFRVNYAGISAERTFFGGPSTIATGSRWKPVEGLEWLNEWVKRRRSAGIMEISPALLSLRGTDTGNLTVVDVDLRIRRIVLAEEYFRPVAAEGPRG